MNARATALIVAAIIFVLGSIGLLYPERVMGLLGFAVLNPSQAAAALGEVRATYGGIFVVMGFLALLAALDPVTNRSRLRFIGLLWLGACAGRLFGVYVDGNPGLPGWVAVTFEAIIGGALVIAAQAAAAPPPVVAPAPAPPSA